MENVLKFHVIYNGCQMRALDATRLHNYIIFNNHKIVNKPEEADFNLLVSCGVIRKQVNSSFSLIEDYLKYKGELIVLGCVPAIAPEEFKSKFDVKFLSTKNMEAIDKFFPDFKVSYSSVPFAHDPYRNHVEYDVFQEREKTDNIKNFKKEFEFSRKFYAKCVSTLKSKLNKAAPIENKDVKYISIASGCRNNCAYCGIRNAIGTLKSKPIESVLTEYEALINQGYRHFRIIADDLGAYGLDTGHTFAELLHAFNKIDKGLKTKWYFEDLNPKWLIKYQDTLLAFVKKKKIVEILCPLQSGNNRILKLMNREYDINEVIALLLKFKKANSLIALISHAIVGYPSETEEEFKETLKMLKTLNCDELTVLGYHDAESILSHKIEPKIAPEVIQERLQMVRSLLAELKTPVARVY